MGEYLRIKWSKDVTAKAKSRWGLRTEMDPAAPALHTDPYEHDRWALRGAYWVPERAGPWH